MPSRKSARTIFLIFSEYTKEEIWEAFYKLPIKDQEFLKRAYGVNLDDPSNRINLSKSEIKRCENLLYGSFRRRLQNPNQFFGSKNVFDYYPEFSKDEVLDAFSRLPKKYQSLVVMIYGPSLDNTSNREDFLELDRRKAISYIRKMKILLEDPSLVGINRIEKSKNVFDYFPNNTKEEVLEAVSRLSKECQELLIKGYGEDLDNPELFYELSEDDRNTIKNIIRTGIKNRISNPKLVSGDGEISSRGKQPKNIFQLFSLYSSDDIKEAVQKLPEDQRDILYKAYGEDLLHPEYRYNLKRAELNQLKYVLYSSIKKILEDMSLNELGAYENFRNFFQFFSDYSKDSVLEAFSRLSLNHQSILKKAYGEELDDSLGFDEMNDLDKKQVMKLMSYNLKKLLVTPGLREENGSHRKLKTIFEIYSQYTRLEILNAISKLNFKQKAFLEFYYGENFDDLSYHYVATEHEKRKCRDIIFKRIKKQLFLLDERAKVQDIFSIVFSYDKEDIMNAFSRISLEQQEILEKYGFNLENVDLFLDLDKSDRKVVSHILSYLKEALEDVNYHYSSRNVHRYSLMDYYSGFSKEQIMEAFGKLSKDDKELMIKAYGDDLDNPSGYSLLSEKEKEKACFIRCAKIGDILRGEEKIVSARRVKGFFEYFSGYQTEDVMRGFNKLPLNIQDLFKKAYGENLDDTSSFSSISSNEKNLIYHYRKNVLKKYLDGEIDDSFFEKEVIVKKFFEFFEDVSMEEVMKCLDKLSSDDYELLIRTYGSDLESTSGWNSLSYSDKKRVHSIINRIRSFMNRGSHTTSKCKNVFEFYPNFSHDEVMEAFNKLTVRSQNVLTRAYGPYLDDTSVFESLSSSEKRKVYNVLNVMLRQKLLGDKPQTKPKKRTTRKRTKRKAAPQNTEKPVRQTQSVLTSDVVNDMFSRLQYKPLSREEEANFIKKLKLYYYNSVSPEEQQLYFDYYCEAFSRSKFREKYEAASSLEKERLLLEAIENAGYYREKFLENNQLLVRSIASKYANVLPLEEGMQVGNFGLMRALEKFDVSKGNKFSTYATFWIRQNIMRYISEKKTIIRTPVHTSERIRTVNRLQNDLYQKFFREPTAEEISEVCGYPVDEVKQLMLFIRYQSTPASLDVSINDEGKTTLGEMIGSDEADFTEIVDDEVFYGDLMALIDSVITDSRVKLVLRERFGLNDGVPKTLDQVGMELGVTRERVRQIEAKGLDMLRRNSRVRDYYQGVSSTSRRKNSAVQELRQIRELLAQADLNLLSKKEIGILNLRYVQNKSTLETARILCISEKDVIGIEKRALIKLRNNYNRNQGGKVRKK